MEHLKNIAIIANGLDGKLEIQGLQYSQKIVGGEHGKNFNHIEYVKRIGDIFIYTERHDIIAIAQGKVKSLPLYASHKDSDCMYKISF